MISQSYLSFSIHQGQERIVQILLENGADANAPGKDGETPLHIAIGNGSSNIHYLGFENFNLLSTNLKEKKIFQVIDRALQRLLSC